MCHSFMQHHPLKLLIVHSKKGGVTDRVKQIWHRFHSLMWHYLFKLLTLHSKQLTKTLNVHFGLKFEPPNLRGKIYPFVL